MENRCSSGIIDQVCRWGWGYLLTINGFALLQALLNLQIETLCTGKTQVLFHLNVLR